MLHTFGQNTKYLCIILLPQQEGYLTQTRGIHATLQSKKYYKITKCPLPHIKTVSTLLQSYCGVWDWLEARIAIPHRLWTLPRLSTSFGELFWAGMAEMGRREWLGRKSYPRHFLVISTSFQPIGALSAKDAANQQSAYTRWHYQMKSIFIQH